MNRSNARELSFKLLYEIEIQKDNSEEHIDLYIENYEITDKKAIDYIKDVTKGIESHSEEIISTIQSNLKEEWELNRVSKINIAILKLAIYEMTIVKLPYKVVINEAVELAKKYGDDTSPSFVNGVLASVVKQQNIS